jgi:hypothetical protein
MKIIWSGFTGGSNFVETSGSYEPSSRSQIGTLTVKPPAVEQDKTYTCTIASIDNPSSSTKQSDVKLNVFCEHLQFFNLYFLFLSSKRQFHMIV